MLHDVKTLTLPAIAETNSNQLTHELAEVRALQAQRVDTREAQIAYWDDGAVVRWNEIARQLVGQHKTNPPLASRAYALLSVAQELAINSARAFQQQFKRSAPGMLDPAIRPLGKAIHRSEFSCPSEAAAIAAASAAVLTHLYPDARAMLAERAQAHMDSRLWAGANVRSDLAAGEVVGRAIAEQVIARAQADGSDAQGTGTLPTGPGNWISAVDQAPVEPLWGRVNPWHLSSGDQFRPPPPPAVGSREFEAALKEVRNVSDGRTAEQLRIAKYWAGGPGTATPPGHWNAIAAALISKHGLDELRSAQVLAMLNTTMMDAGIACWDAKYVYGVIRPSQADERITLPVGLPNFPSYVSGHASFSGAAAEILAHFFPEEQIKLRAMAEEAAESRLFGGIHYRFDNEEGLKLGRVVANHVIERSRP